jgi:hypothetical protein
VHAPAARQQEEVLEALLNEEIDDVIREFHWEEGARERCAASAA